MKSLRPALVFAVALAASSAAPTTAQQKDAPAPLDAARRDVVTRYFEAAPDAPAPDAAEKKLQSMREMFTDLAEEVGKLRRESKDLRADNDALKRKLEEYERVLRWRRDNRPGALVIPPEAPRGQPGNAVPKNWKPFEFNGATYYLVPLKAEQDETPTRTKRAVQLAPAAPAAPAPQTPR